MSPSNRWVPHGTSPWLHLRIPTFEFCHSAFLASHLSATDPSPPVFLSSCQGRLTISGRVRCLDVCGPNLRVGLQPVGGEGVVEWVEVGEDSQKFLFEGVGPGNYVLKVTDFRPPINLFTHGHRRADPPCIPPSSDQEPPPP